MIVTDKTGGGAAASPIYYAVFSARLEATLLHHSLGDLLEAGDVGASHQIVTQTVLGSGLGGHLVDVQTRRSEF